MALPYSTYLYQYARYNAVEGDAGDYQKRPERVLTATTDGHGEDCNGYRGSETTMYIIYEIFLELA